MRKARATQRPVSCSGICETPSGAGSWVTGTAGYRRTSNHRGDSRWKAVICQRGLWRGSAALRGCSEWSGRGATSEQAAQNGRPISWSQADGVWPAAGLITDRSACRSPRGFRSRTTRCLRLRQRPEPGTRARRGQTNSVRFSSDAEKGVEGQLSGGRNSCRPVAVSMSGGGGRTARTQARRNASKLGAGLGLEGRQRPVGKRVEFARLDILGELAIPGRGIELSKPFPKGRQFCLGQRCHFLFEAFDFTHAVTPHPKW